MLHMKWYNITWRVGCGKLKMYTINSKAITKIKQKRIIIKKPLKETKWNYRKYSI